MVIIILEKVPVGLRGELTRWMLELRTGVFIGKLSAMVRDRLWEMICEGSKGSAAILIHGADNEQGFAIQFAGPTSRCIVDFEGLLLVRTP
jgi:CRISPR-associated protein Cas2